MKLIFNLNGSEELRDFLWQFALANHKHNFENTNKHTPDYCPFFFYSDEAISDVKAGDFGQATVESNIVNRLGFSLTQNINRNKANSNKKVYLIVSEVMK